MSAVSRRDLFRVLLGRGKSETPAPVGATTPADDQVAVVMGRFCLAYQGSFCSVCSERCPEPGAIVVEQGLPRVVPDLCTGCGICRDVCPAPKNAVLLCSRPPITEIVPPAETPPMGRLGSRESEGQG